MNASSSSTLHGLAVRQDSTSDRGQNKTALEPAGAPGDLVIYGNGFFIVRDPENNIRYATQAGRFNVDAEGYLVTCTGARVQGCIDASLTIAGDIQINAAGLPATSAADSIIQCYAIDEQGKIIVHLSDGSCFLRGQIMLQNFEDPQALVCEGNQLYSNLADAGPLPALAPPGSNGLGIIQSGVLEFSSANAWNSIR